MNANEHGKGVEMVYTVGPYLETSAAASRWSILPAIPRWQLLAILASRLLTTTMMGGSFGVIPTRDHHSGKQ